MAERFLEMLDEENAEFQKLLKEIEEGSDIFEKCMSPPSYTSQKFPIMEEETRHFVPIIHTPERPITSEYDPWYGMKSDPSSLSISAQADKVSKLEKRVSTKIGKTDPKTLLCKLNKLQLKLVKDLKDACDLTDQIQEFFKERRVPLKTLIYN